MATKLNTEEVIQRITNIHGDLYDLSLLRYQNRRTKITLVCRTHGPWKTTIEQITRGQGCSICGKNKASENRRLTFEEYKKKANQIHKNKYQYLQEKYIKSSLPTTILCETHGPFKMLAHNHIGTQKQGCPSCGVISQKNKRKMTVDDFLLKAKKVHSGKYNYSEVTFENQKDFIRINCPKHGTFLQNISNHLTGSGCPDCNNSKGENKVKEILIQNNITFIQQKTFPDLKDISLLKCDFYLPLHNCVIEFNGRQHFEAITKFGGEIGLKDTQRRDLLKKKYFKKNKIKLIEISYLEKNIETKILKLLGKY